MREDGSIQHSPVICLTSPRTAVLNREPWRPSLHRDSCASEWRRPLNHELPARTLTWARVTPSSHHILWVQQKAQHLHPSLLATLKLAPLGVPNPITPTPDISTYGTSAATICKLAEVPHALCWLWTHHHLQQFRGHHRNKSLFCRSHSNHCLLQNNPGLLM